MPRWGLFLVVVAALVTEPSDGLPATTPPAFEWRQILSVPRIGGRFRSISVDSSDPRRIFVGTEEGTLLRTTDGGVTWREFEVKPDVVMERSLGLQTPGLPRLGATTTNNFKIYVDPPGQRFTDRVPIPSVSDPFPVKPDWFFAGFLATSPRGSVNVLYQAIKPRKWETRPIWRIVQCPGATLFPLLAATSRELFGSMDDGLTWLRIFGNPGPLLLDNVDCSPSRPDEISVATGVGLFVSKDGGMSFDQNLSAWPGQRATACGYGVGPDGKTERLFSASGSELFAQIEPGSDEMTIIYPDDDPATAPWETINWISTTEQGVVWLATDDGARVSPDGGESWITAARTLLSRQEIWQVQIGESETGDTRVALIVNARPLSLRGRYVGGLQDSVVYSSDDNGTTWHPFFHGLSRRTFRQMASVQTTPTHPAGWWIVTSGEVWTNYPAQVDPGIPDDDSMDWAEARLERTPPMGELMQDVLHATGLSNPRIAQLATDHRRLNLVPRIDLQFLGSDHPKSARETYALLDGNTGIVSVQQLFGTNTRLFEFSFFAQFSWELDDALGFTEEVYPTRNDLHELRRQVAFATEDAWNERMIHLNLLAEGMSDPVQIGVLKTRVEALEAMLAVWLRRDFYEEKKK